MLVSSTEPATLRALGTPHTKPEDWGVDFLWFAGKDHGWAGVQRKEMSDLIASIKDGRLGKELVQGTQLAYRLLVIEGTYPKLLNEHYVIDKWTKIPVAQWHGVLWKCQAEGWMVAHAHTMQDTAAIILMFREWTKRDKHSSLTTRPGPTKNTWGQRGNKEYQRHLLMGLERVGPELADRILEHFGGVPWSWNVTREELMAVEGVGPKKADRMLQAFGTPPADSSLPSLVL